MEISFDKQCAENQPYENTSDLVEPPEISSENKQQEEIDLEDGEIEDDEDEEAPPEQPQEAQEPPQDLQNGPSPSKSEKSAKVVKKLEQDLLQNAAPLSPSHSEKSVERHSRRGSKDRDFSREKVRKSSKREHKKERKEDKEHRRMTEAERSILHLRKKEKMLRGKDSSKWPKKETDGLDDDFAKNIEKTLATILHKKEKEAAALTSGNEEVDKEEKRAKKRKKHSKDKDKHKAKRKRTNIDSPRSEIDENEMLNIRSGSPGGGQPLLDPMGALGGPHIIKRSRSPSSESFDEEEVSNNEERDDRPRRRYKDRDSRDRGGRDGNRDRNWRNKKDRNDRSTRNNNRRDRDMRRQTENSSKSNNKMELQDSQGVCVFYMQGKCQKSDCPYSHEVSPPMKLELCKFYLMDCCAKGDNCSYMHGEFPCKFYHTGLQCTQGEDCKFAHGSPLSEGLKQILFKHIETAPRDILGGFPRLSREEALNLINITQKKLQNEYANPTAAGGGVGDSESDGHDLLKGGIPSLFDINVPVPPELAQGLDSEIKLPTSIQDKKPRVTRWQQKDDKGFPSQFSYGSDQDMRISSYNNAPSSNGDIDMRTLPSLVSSNSQTSLHSSTSMDIDGQPLDSTDHQTDNSSTAIDASKKDVDIRQTPGLHSFAQDVDNRQPICFSIKPRDVDIRPQLIAKTLETSKVFQPEAEDDEDSSSGSSPKMNQGDKNQQEIDSSHQKQFVPGLGFSQSTMDLIARITANNPTDLNSIPVPQTDYRPSPHEPQQPQSQPQDESNDNINWYSDDDDDDEHRLTIKVEEEENRRDSISKEEETTKNQEDDDEKRHVDDENMDNSSPPPEIKPTDIVGKLGDLSKIDISAEVTKLLTSMSQNKFAPDCQQEGGSSRGQSPPSTSRDSCIVDPRISSKKSNRRESTSSQESASPRHSERRSSKEFVDPRWSRNVREKEPRKDSREARDPREAKDPRETKEKDTKDPRLGGEDPRNRRKGSLDEKKSEKMSIYEQGGLDMQAALNEIESEDFKSSLRPDIDLRNLTLPFKGMQNYTPATEIDASLNSHLPMAWKVAIVDVPRPDYTGLKLSINDAEKTGDPRLRKLFRLSIDEKDSPMSPKASPKTSSVVRVDPRLRKPEEKPSTTTTTAAITDPQQITYNQQLTILQSSQFYQSLTSNQKLMLNQELAERYEQNTGTDPFLFSLLTNLNLLPNSGGIGVTPITSMSGAVQNMNSALLPSLSKLNPAAALPILAAQQGLHLGQQGLLGAAPGIPNIPMDFPINFDPRNGGLLGNAPPPVMFGNQGYMPMEGAFNNDDFYQGNEGPNMNNQGGGSFRGGGGHHNRNDRNFNNRDNRRRGGRNNFNNNRNNNRDFKNNRGGRNNRQNRHHSPE